MVLEGHSGIEVAPDGVRGLQLKPVSFRLDIPVDGRTLVDGFMTTDQQLLEDVIVFGYRKEQRAISQVHLFRKGK